jgi:flagellar assembly factor FliW
MLNVKTTRFGDVSVEEEQLIHFPEGLLGFPDQKDYLMMEHKPGSPFYWLQSVSVPELAFVMINPLLVKKDFLEALSASDRKFFVSEKEGDKAFFSLVTIPTGKVEEMTSNLLGPLVIDVRSRTGRQVILSNTGYSHRHPVPTK